MSEEIQFKGKVNKGIAGYSNIMTKDPRFEVLRGKTCIFKIMEIETTTEAPGATITESKKVA